MKDGLGSSKYKPAEYEKLQAIVDAKLLQSAHIAQKVDILDFFTLRRFWNIGALAPNPHRVSK
jgi:hypothetical protein